MNKLTNAKQKSLVKKSLKSVEADVYYKPLNAGYDVDDKPWVYMKGFWAAKDGSCEGEYVEAYSVREFWANLKKTMPKNIKIDYRKFLFGYGETEHEFLKNYLG